MTATVPAAMRREDLPADCCEAAALLNQGCVCRSVDSRRLKRALEAGREDLAREALTRKSALVIQRDDLQTQLDQDRKSVV